MENWLGVRIKSLRKRRGLTQEQLAELCNVSTSCVSRWETGSLYPRKDNLSAIATALKICEEDLFIDPQVPISKNLALKEFAPLIEKLDADEREYFLNTLQAYLEMKEKRCFN